MWLLKEGGVYFLERNIGMKSLYIYIYILYFQSCDISQQKKQKNTHFTHS